MPRAFITGITGQDGQHLAEFLHGQGYDVFGMVKGQNNPKADAGASRRCRSSSWSPATSPTCRRWWRRWRSPSPTRCTTSGRSASWRCRFNQAELTANITGLGVLRMLEAIRMVGGTHEQPDPLLPGVVVGDVRQGARDAADRADAVPPALAVRVRQGVRPRHHRELPRSPTACSPARGSCSTTRGRGGASSS